MSVGLVQSTSGDTAGSPTTSKAVTYGSNNVPGNLLVCVCAVHSGSAITPVMSNSGWTKLTTPSSGAATTDAITYWIKVATGATTDKTVTCTVLVNSTICVDLYELSGQAASIVDSATWGGTNAATPGTSVQSKSGGGTIGSAGQFAIAALEGATSVSSAAVDQSFNLLSAHTDARTAYLALTGAVNPTFSGFSSQNVKSGLFVIDAAPVTGIPDRNYPLGVERGVMRGTT